MVDGFLDNLQNKADCVCSSGGCRNVSIPKYSLGQFRVLGF